MKRFFYLFIGIIIGFLFSILYNKHADNKNIRQQSDTLINQVKKMNKMIVTEAYFDEVYSYGDTNKYLFDILNFDKNVILLVKAKAQISYDLSKLSIELDSIHKTIYIKNIPKEKIEIFPSVKYYDIQQSTLNQFSSKELNKINNEAIEQIKSHINISKLRLKAKKQLLENLENLYILSKIYGWKIEDKHLIRNLKSDLLL